MKHRYESMQVPRRRGCAHVQGDEDHLRDHGLHEALGAAAPGAEGRAPRRAMGGEHEEHWAGPGRPATAGASLAAFVCLPSAVTRRNFVASTTVSFAVW